MGVTICLPLFANPGQEMEEGVILQSQHLRTLQVELQERLTKLANQLEALAAAGWTARLAMFDAILHHPEVETQAQAETRLRAVGIPPEELMILEDLENLEDEDFE